MFSDHPIYVFYLQFLYPWNKSLLHISQMVGAGEGRDGIDNNINSK